MKCTEDNRCISNPKRYDPAKHARNTLKKPVQYWEHGDCPYRKDGNCNSVGRQLARIERLRDVVRKYRAFLETIKDWKIVKENISFRDQNFIRSIGGEITSFNNPKLGRTDWFVKIKDWKSGTLQDYLGGFVSRNLEYIGNISMNYSDLVKRFDMIKITDKKIELFGELDNFNDNSIFDWNTDEDVEFNTWFSKEFTVNGKRVIVNIREVK
jgi:hypothetical protein